MINENKITDFHVVFCGFDKFNQLSFFKKIIDQKNIRVFFVL